MTDTASSSDTSYRQSLNRALHASRILTGALDDELGIKKTTKTTKLGAKHQAENNSAIYETLSERLRSAVSSWEDLASFQLFSDPEVATGDLALHLLLCIHTCLIEKKNDVESRVAVDADALPGLKRKGLLPKEDVGLGIKDVKLATTLQSLASRWALGTRIKAYDRALFDLAPKGFNQMQSKRAPTKLTPNNRFQEIDDDAEAKDRASAKAAFTAARNDLAGVVDQWMSNLKVNNTTAAQGEQVAASTDVVTVMLRVGIVDFLASLLRLGFGPNAGAKVVSPTPVKDEIQKQSSAATTRLLRFLSTHSAMSALSFVIALSDAKLGAPAFVKTVSSRLLSAQLLRPDGVRSLFIITFGGADLAETDIAGESGQHQGTGTAAPGSNSLKRLEQCSRLLLTPPQGMPVDVYMPIILPHLLDILAPIIDPSSNLTPPPQEQMRAAGFVLTRISERHPELFKKAMHDRVYSKFKPSPPSTSASNAETDAEAVVVTSSGELDYAISVLSSFLLFSEPSPTFFTLLFEPILPQLLALYSKLHTPKAGAGKARAKSLESASQADKLKVEVSNFLKTWVRLVDAEQGARSFVQGIQAAAASRIGYKQETASDERDFFWSEDEDGISIRFGHPPTSGQQVISSLLKDLSLAALTKQISEGHDDEMDLTKIAPDLSAKLGLQPDPRLVATLLKSADRKDMARLMLPSILNIYMAQKSASRARMVGVEEGSSTETRSVLYLQLILQLLDTFGSHLLQGDIQATLAFIDFSLSSPSQTQLPSQHEETSAEQGKDDADDIPFISAKSTNKSSSAVPSLFNIAVESQEQRSSANKFDQNATKEEQEQEADEEDEELVSTALSLLLSLLESDPALSTESHPMLLVIADKIESFLDSVNAEIRSLAKEAKLVLMARRNSLRGPARTSDSKKGAAATSETSTRARAYAQAQETYHEALKLLQDPILSVRAHGLVLLRRLVSDGPKADGQAVGKVDPALLPAILDIFLHAIQDEESYLYLNAVQGLSALASSGGGQTIARLVGIYIGRDDGLASQALPVRQVEKRLRVGEALLQVIQRCGDALVAHMDSVVPPLLVKLSDRALPNVLRSSFVSILGTVVEAVPLAMARKGYAAQLVQICIDIVVIEMVQRPNSQPKGPVKMNVQGKRVDNPDEDEEEKTAAKDQEQRKLDSATVVDPKVAHLRRAAMLLLTLLVRGTRFQLEEADDREGGQLVEKLLALRLPGGGRLPSVANDKEEVVRKNSTVAKPDLLLAPDLVQRLKQVATYISSSDTDAIVRTHAHDCIQHLDALSLDLVRSAIAFSQ